MLLHKPKGQPPHFKIGGQGTGHHMCPVEMNKDGAWYQVSTPSFELVSHTALPLNVDVT
jgi:hypothetical protein